jgi:hypothetical protein
MGANKNEGTQLCFFCWGGSWELDTQLYHLGLLTLPGMALNSWSFLLSPPHNPFIVGHYQDGYMVDGLYIPIWHRIKKTLAIALSGVQKGLRERDYGGNINNVQYKTKQNCHYESPSHIINIG